MGGKGSKKDGKGITQRGRRGVIPLSRSKAQKGKKESPRRWYVLLAVIGLITLVSYFNCLPNQFVFDDVPLIRNNPTIRSIEKIPRLLGIGKSRIAYRPIRVISYTIDYTLNKKLWQNLGGYKGYDKGLNPLGYHLANIFYHLITSLLVFLVIYTLSDSYRVAFIAACLFALHPVHTDSVTYISGRRDILCALFYLMGFYFFLRYRHTGKIAFSIASFMSYLLSLGSKEMGVTLPALFLCYDLVQQFTLKPGQQVTTGVTGKRGTIILTYGRRLYLSLKTVILQSMYLYSLTFLGALVFCYYKVFTIYPSDFSGFYHGKSAATNFLTVGKIVVHYLKLLLYPIVLNADYSYNAFPLSSSFLEPSTFISFIVLAVAGYALLRLVAHHRMLAFGGIWFFVTLLPVCHIFPHHELLAEHYLYLPSVGLCLVGGILLNSLLSEKRYLYLTSVLFAAVVLLFSLRIVDRNRDWRNPFTLLEKTIKTAPQCARAHYNLGVKYAKSGMINKAISLYKKALLIQPLHAETHNNLGRSYTQKGMLDEAIYAYKRALALEPRYALAHNNLGVAYAQKGMLDEAISAHKRAVAIRPRYADGHFNLANDYLKKNSFKEAIYEYRRTLALKPRYAKAYYYLAFAYFKKKEYQLAIQYCDGAKKLGYKVNPKLLKELLPYRKK